jgi:hypothetical protein
MSNDVGFGSQPFGTSTFGSNRFGDAKAIIDRAMRATGLAIDDLDSRELAIDLLNMRYNHCLSGKNWKFLQRTMAIDLFGPYSTGTIKLTQNSDKVSESIDPTAVPPTQPLTFNQTLVGQTFIAKGEGGESSSYEVDKIITPKQIQLSSKYAGDDANFTSYKILKDHYWLEAKVGKIRSALLGGSYGRNPELILIGRQELRQLQKRQSFQESIPQYLCTNEYEDNGSGRREVIIWPAPDKRYTLEIDYDVRITALEDVEGCYTLLPEEYNSVLFYALCADLYENQNNPSAADRMQAKYMEAFKKMAGDYEMTDNKARIMMKTKYYQKPRLRSMRHNSTRYAGLEYFGLID